MGIASSPPACCPVCGVPSGAVADPKVVAAGRLGEAEAEEFLGLWRLVERLGCPTCGKDCALCFSRLTRAQLHRLAGLLAVMARPATGVR